MEHIFLFLCYATFMFCMVLLMGLLEKSKLFNKLTEKFLNDEE